MEVQGQLLFDLKIQIYLDKNTAKEGEITGMYLS